MKDVVIYQPKVEARANIDNPYLVDYFIDGVLLTPELYILNYRLFIVKEIANGKPSKDTVDSYCYQINLFLRWCLVNKITRILQMHEEHIKAYREYLFNRGLKHATINSKLNAVRRFYHCAKKLNLVPENPAADVRAPIDPDEELAYLRFMTEGQVELLFMVIDEAIAAAQADSDKKALEKVVRDKVMIMLMLLEGLRTVEVMRFNLEDINWQLQVVKIRGKTGSDYIYPRPDTMELLKYYLDCKVAGLKDGPFTPVFTSTSNNNRGKRISRIHIRKNINFWLARIGIREGSNSPNLSCHMLRHTTGSWVYEKTGSMKAVQDTLRHKSINMSARYTHARDRMLNRYTTALPIVIKIPKTTP